MAHGKPIIAHDNVYNREVLNGYGLYFDTEVSLEKQVNYIENSYQIISKRSIEAKRRIAEYYSWNSVLNKYRNLFN
jgi:glycosyltransferase involved in cell wall biosynthesis